MKRYGNCYAATEALYHILGGKRAGWTPMVVRCSWMRRGRGRATLAQNDVTHWFLKHRSGLIVDPSRLQFRAKGWWLTPDYAQGRGCGFLTKRPSWRAKRLMQRLTWSLEGKKR